MPFGRGLMARMKVGETLSLPVPSSLSKNWLMSMQNLLVVEVLVVAGAAPPAACCMAYTPAHPGSLEKSRSKSELNVEQKVSQNMR